MGSLNKCEFIGNIGKDPEVSQTATGMTVSKFSLAVNEKFRDKETTTWVNITAFDKLAALTSQYCRKGQQLYVEGRLSIRNYDKQDGSKGTWVEILANKIVFLGGKKDADSQENQAQQADGIGAGSSGFDDSDIPF
jgi:single-strand DNA-binding protein